MPTRYVIPQSDTQAVRVLRQHGIAVGQAGQSPANTQLVAEAYVFAIDSVVTAARPFQGHRETRLAGSWRKETRRITAGSFVVATSQPLGLLAVYLLEPQSDDGLVSWNFFDSELRPGGIYPVFKTGGAPPTP